MRIALAVVLVAGCASSFAAPPLGVIGIVADDDGPVADAYVRLAPEAGGQVVVVRSGSDGKYRATSLAPGEWSVSASKLGHAPRAHVITVAHGDVALDFKLPVQRNNIIRGVVRDAAGPVQGLRVDAFQPGSTGEPIDGQIATALTRADGGYDLTVGSHGVVVVAQSPDHAPAVRAVRLSGAGDAEVVDLMLLAAGGIEGRVVDAKRAAIVGAAIDVWVASPTPLIGSYLHVVSDAKGAFRLGGLGSGSYELRARRGRQASIDAAAISLATGERAADVELVVGPTALVRGVVVDAHGPVAGVAVSATMTHVSRTVTTDLAGRFVLEGLPPGDYLLEALGNDPRSVRRDITVADRDLDVKLVLDDAVANDEAPEPSPLQLPPPPPSSCSANTVSCCTGCNITCDRGRRASCQPGNCVDEYRVQSKVNQKFSRCARAAACTCS